MKALITGASSGIGMAMADVLFDMGCDLILVSRNKEMLESLKKKYGRKTKIIDMDLSSTYNCMELYELCKNKVDVLINNAGFGDCGFFDETNLEKDLNMIDLNIKAVHVLTKLFLKDFYKHNRGFILNVASAAAFAPGPLMATYYSTKKYVLSLTKSLDKELKELNSNVYVGCLCPGPVNTNFNKVANVKFNLKGMSKEKVAEYAIKEMFKKKTIIIPGFFMKTNYLLSKISSDTLKAKVIYKVQKKKVG